MKDLIKIFEMRLKQHTNNAKRAFNKHNSDKVNYYLGKRKECEFIIEHLKLEKSIQENQITPTQYNK